MKDYPPFTEQELIDKFNRACNFKKMSNAQRDEAYKVWSNLGAVNNFADAVKTLAKFRATETAVIWTAMTQGVSDDESCRGLARVLQLVAQPHQPSGPREHAFFD